MSLLPAEKIVWPGHAQYFKRTETIYKIYCGKLGLRHTHEAEWQPTAAVVVSLLFENCAH